MIDGRDVSSFQDANSTPQQIDFGLMKAAGIEYVGIRAASGQYIDEDFKRNWKAAKDAGLPRKAYFWWNYLNGSPKGADQVKFWMSLIADDPGEIPPAIDFEKPNQNYPELPSREVCIDVLWNYFYFLKKDFELERGTFYSNPASIVARLVALENGKYVAPSWLRQHYLWVAHWYVTKPTLLYGWEDWTFWQYGLGKGTGPKYGVESLDIDCDYFNGTLEQLLALTGKKPAPAPSPALTLEERIARLEKLHTL